MSATRYELHGAVAVITLDNPPVNGLGHALRRGVSEGLDRARQDDAARCIVLIGNANGFSGGADLREFGTPAASAAPNLRALIAEVEESEKPVIAAISGMAMGGGLELALGCHYRVAAPGARIALPEVKLGLLPGAGGTQRLPRLVGLESALDMIVSGNARFSQELAGTRLFDRMIEGDLLAGAIDFARAVAALRPLPRVRDMKVDQAAAEGFLGLARSRVQALAKHYPAPQACIAAVAASLGPFDEGLAEERAHFARLVQSPESAALRHAFFAERAAAKISGVSSGTAVRKIRSAGVIGAGTMGGGIAMCFANAGIAVKVLDTSAEALEKGLAVVRGHYESAVRKGKLAAEELQRRSRLISGTLAAQDLADADILIEAVFEDLEVKRRVFQELDALAKPGAILASNTSTLDIDALAGFTARPAEVLGLHFFSPANVMRLLEVVRGRATSNEVLASSLALAKKLNKVAVVAGVCDGFIGNRMLRPYMRQAELLLQEGCVPQQVDGALESWGWAMGPCRMADLAGNDVAGFIRRRHYAQQPDAPRSQIADRLVELGRFGQKSGRGYYRYEPGGREALADPEVERLIVDVARGAGLTRRRIGEEEIIERCMFALINEGARVLEEGIAARASDIDVVYLTGYGFPVFRGGPMFYADTVGLPGIIRAMRRFAENPASDPGFWQPAPLLARLAEEGGTFSG
jgi:3-hydroxyacyl-CoA dehydrogenase